MRDQQATTGDAAVRPASWDAAARGDETMRAVVQDRYGSADVLRETALPRPEVGTGDVLVRVHAAGVSRGTWHLMTGRPYLLRLVFGLRRPRTPVLGQDLAGTVVAAGSGVTRFAVGDGVYGIGRGSFAEFAVAREGKLARKPISATWEEAAVAPVSALTALQSLTDVGHLQPGQRVLIVGASGGVGSYAVQIAAALGAEVTGVCSTAKRDLVRALGAHGVVDYTREEVGAGDDRYDLIIDIAGHTALALLRRMLTPTGTLVLVGGEEGGDWTGGAIERQLRARVRSLLGRQRLTSCLCKERGSDLERLTGLIDAGSVRSCIDRTYPLSEVSTAMRHLAAGDARGKLAITVLGDHSSHRPGESATA